MPGMSPLHRLAIGVTATVALYCLYGLTGLYNVGSLDQAHTLETALDGLIPFTPAATLAYIFLVPQTLAPLAVLEDARAAWRAVVSIVLMIFLFMIIWLSYPVTVPREPVPVTDLWTWGVALARWIDPPTNCFPSAHVADAVLAAMVVRRADRALGNGLLVTAGLIAWSTVALDQHWLLDGLVGAAAAVAVEAGVARFWRLPPEALRPGPRSRLVWLLVVFLGLFLAAAAPYWMGVDLAASDPSWAR